MPPITTSLRNKLLVIRARQLQHPNADDVLLTQDVVVLTLGMGPALYLGLDGRITIWHYEELWGIEPPRFTDRIEEIAPALVRGTDNLQLPELLELLPTRPIDSILCPTCSGERWMRLRIQSDENTGCVVCPHCYGLGWLSA